MQDLSKKEKNIVSQGSQDQVASKEPLLDHKKDDKETQKRNLSPNDIKIELKLIFERINSTVQIDDKSFKN